MSGWDFAAYAPALCRIFPKEEALSGGSPSKRTYTLQNVMYNLTNPTVAIRLLCIVLQKHLCASGGLCAFFAVVIIDKW